MRNLLLMIFMVLGFSLYVFAQSSPVASPAPKVVVSVPAAVAPVAAASLAPAAVSPAAPVSSVPSAGFIGIVVAIVAGLNVLLSGVQTIFGNLSKSEPGWLQTVSSIVSNVAKWLGSNPSV